MLAEQGSELEALTALELLVGARLARGDNQLNEGMGRGLNSSYARAFSAAPPAGEGGCCPALSARETPPRSADLVRVRVRVS